MSFEGLIIRGHHTSAAYISHILDEYPQSTCLIWLPPCTDIMWKKKGKKSFTSVTTLSINFNLHVQNYAHISIKWLNSMKWLFALWQKACSKMHNIKKIKLKLKIKRKICISRKLKNQEKFVFKYLHNDNSIYDFHIHYNTLLLISKTNNS